MTREEAIRVGGQLTEQAYGRGYLGLRAKADGKTNAGIDISASRELTKAQEDAANAGILIISKSPSLESPIEVGDIVRAMGALNFISPIESPVEGFEVVYVQEHNVLTINKSL